jgi:hypothetical protein
MMVIFHFCGIGRMSYCHPARGMGELSSPNKVRHPGHTSSEGPPKGSNLAS